MAYGGFMLMMTILSFGTLFNLLVSLDCNCGGTTVIPAENVESVSQDTLSLSFKHDNSGSTSDMPLQSIIREPPPADENRSNCVDTDTVPNSLHYYESYSYSGCMVECKTEYIIRKCGCTDPFQPALNGTKICTFPEMLNCSANAFKAFPSDTEGLTKCDCHDPCVDYEYNVQVSNFRFPSTNFIRQADMPEEQVKWMRDNVVLLDIFYGKMSYHRLEEDLAYNVLDMIANLGGTLGLCIGGSALTLCEFAEYAILAVCRCVGCRDKDGKGNNSRVSSVIKVAPADETRDTG